MSNPTNSIQSGAEQNPQALEALTKRAAAHPQKSAGDVCIGTLPTRGGELVVWSAEDSRDFCKIAGASARKVGYLPWQEVRDFIRERLDPARVPAPMAEIPSLLQAGEGPTAVGDDERETKGRDLGGKVVELREIRPRAFFWETLREVAPAQTLRLVRK